jgi:uncharacterized repeat protein (TIGR03803 family)
LAVVLFVVVVPRSAQSQTYEVLHAFHNTGDGALPFAAVIRDSAGNLYGTAGGYDTDGNVFKLSPAGKFTNLYNFTGGKDGLIPWAGVIRDAEGNLYGTTAGRTTHGYGGVFKLSPSGKDVNAIARGKPSCTPFLVEKTAAIPSPV